MIAYALIDRDGIPTGGGMGRELPKGAVALTPPWTTLDLPRIMLQDAIWTLRPKPVEPPPPTATERAEAAAAALARARTAAIMRINTRAGHLRLRVYTDIPGQDALYLEKRAEALAYVASPQDPDLADFPLIAGEVGPDLTARTPYELAQIWLNRSHLFKLVGGATETARLKAAYAVASAANEDTISAIEQGFVEALSRLPI
jgi:hypothetical protein